eukprot:TRINITY_DN641_c0_g1_i1.p1 TRINITY_DN641_c0_g1~~TRINITY_DN641_c0_g1_i1.p1  ORF type:complete len:347 (+),score=91.62 TRINITY_DN641_c0_g1_i1:128-1168(+)
MIFSKDGHLFAAGGGDGDIRTFPSNGPYNHPSHSFAAHSDGTTITSICFIDDYQLATRAMDDSLKFWDLRRPGVCSKEYKNLPTYFEFTDVITSPSGDYIVTGTSFKSITKKEKEDGSIEEKEKEKETELGGERRKKKEEREVEEKGLLLFFRRDNFELANQIGVPSGVGRLKWHPKLNQLIVGCSDSRLLVYYDPALSTKGALLSVVREKRKPDPNDFVPQRAIHNPHALPLFKALPSSKRQREKARKDPIKSKKPDLPVQGPGYNGQLGSTLTQHLMKTLIKKNDRNEDPREAILKYAQEAEKNPFWFKAYQKTQPQQIFDYEALEAEQKYEEQKQKKKSEKKK